jgi:hypothetical protein
MTTLSSGNLSIKDSNGDIWITPSESFILLRDIPQVSFELFYTEPDKVAAMASLHTPVVMVENDCVLVVGTPKSILKEAFSLP